MFRSRLLCLKALRRDALGLGLLTVLVTLVAWRNLTDDVWLSRHDILTQFLPWYAYLGERLRAGEIPGWNPHQFSGAPFAGDPQSGWMYLPAMLFTPFLAPATALKTIVVFALAFAAFSTYAFARVLRMGVVAALVGAVVFAFGPFLQQNTHCCTARGQVALWIPLALLGVELALRAKTWHGRLAPWCVTGLAISQMLAGWFGQGAINALLVVASYIGYRALLSPPFPDRSLQTRLLTCVTTGLASLGLGTGLGAAGLLPRLAVNAVSNLAGGDYTAIAQGYNVPPYPPLELLDLILGDGPEARTVALGGAALVLAPLALILAGRRFGVPYFAILTVVVFTLSLDTTPLHWLFYLIPRYQQIHEHYPPQITAVVMIGPAMLSAAAVASLGRWRRARPPGGFPLLGLPVLAIALAAVGLAIGGYGVTWPPLFAATLVTVLVIWTLARPVTDRLARCAPLLLLVIVFAQPTGHELLAASTGWLRDPLWDPLWDPNPALALAVTRNLSATDPGGAGAFLQERQAEEGPFRYLGYGGTGHPEAADIRSYMARREEPEIGALLVNGRSIFLGLADIQGYNPVQLARYVHFITALNGRPQDYHTADIRLAGVASPLLNLLNVRYILLDARLPPDRDDVVALRAGRPEVFRNERVIVYENPAAFPRAWIVHSLRSINRDAAPPLLASGEIDLRQTALVELAAGAKPPDMALPPAGAIETAQITELSPDRIRLTTLSASAGLLVLSEVYAPGWRATVDGEPVEVLPADYLFRALPLPAGAHRVELRYAPASLEIGLWLSALSAFVVLAAFSHAAWRAWYRGPILARSAHRTRRARKFIERVKPQ